MKKIHWTIWAILLSFIILGVAGYYLIDLVTPQIGLCLANADSDMEQTLEKALKIAGYTVLIEDEGNTAEAQTQQVASLLKKGVKLLVIQPAHGTDAKAIIEMAGQTPVLFIETEPENLEEGYFVGWNLQKLGNMQAALLDRYFTKADVNGDRSVHYMILSASGEDAYFSGIEEGSAAYKTAQLETTVCQDTADSAKVACKQAFSKYGRDLELIFCDSPALATGAAEAIRENGRTPGRDVIVIGAGTEDACKEFVRTGTFTAALVEDSEALCDQVVNAVKAILGGKEVQQKYCVDYKVLTHENVDK